MKRKYCVKIRFYSDLYTQPDWVPVSWHVERKEAEKSLTWQRKQGGPYLEAKIFLI